MAAFGVIFDLDGVLIDSGKLHIEAWIEFAREHHLATDREYFWSTFGRRNAEIIPEIFGGNVSLLFVEEKSERKEAIFRRMAASQLVGLPGAEALVNELKNAGIPMVIGTSTPGSNLVFFRNELPFLQQMNGYVCGDDVKIGKPNPEVFLKAGAINRLAPAFQIVIEDALAGIEAAKAGGFKCIAVATTESRAVLEKTNADLVVNCMADLNYGVLARL